MNEYYKAIIIKNVQQDTYENGCLPETSQCFGIIHKIQNQDLKKLVNEIESFCGGKAFIFGYEINRLEVQVLENENGYEASKVELELFKENKINLWLADYSCYVSKIIETNVNLENEDLNLEII